LIAAAADVHLNEHGYTGQQLAHAIRLTYDEMYEDFLQRPGEKRAGLSIVG
jgi:hypothetical protein